MLTSGMVPALYADDEKESIVGSVCNTALTQTGKDDTKLLILINMTQTLQALLDFLHSFLTVFWEQRLADFAWKSITANSFSILEADVFGILQYYLLFCIDSSRGYCSRLSSHKRNDLAVLCQQVCQQSPHCAGHVPSGRCPENKMQKLPRYVKELW